MQFAPDGRLFVCQQGGALRVIKDGVLLPTPFVTVTVNAEGERGLLGVAFDPRLRRQPVRLRLLHDRQARRMHNRVSRFTANGDVAAPAAKSCSWTSTTSRHATTTAARWTSVPMASCMSPSATNADRRQRRSRCRRGSARCCGISPDGSIPADNPFYRHRGRTQPGDLGLRPAQSVHVRVQPRRPGRRRCSSTTSASSHWRRSTTASPAPTTAGPHIEGYAPHPGLHQPAFTPTTTVARRLRHHRRGVLRAGATWSSRRRTSTTTSSPTTVPASSGGSTAATNTVTGFATGIAVPVDLKVGADGLLYYLCSRRRRRVPRGIRQPCRRHHRPPGQPDRVARAGGDVRGVGQRHAAAHVSSGSASRRANWTDAASAASYTLASPQLADNGARFRVNVANAAGNVFSDEAVLTVTQQPGAGGGHHRCRSPDCSTPAGRRLRSPAPAPTRKTAPLPPSAFTWRVDFHHDTHVHPFLPATSGLTTRHLRDSGHWRDRRQRLVPHPPDRQRQRRTDAHRCMRDVFPRVVRVTLATSPAGLQVRLDGPAGDDAARLRQRGRRRPRHRRAGPARQRRRLRVRGLVGWRARRAGRSPRRRVGDDYSARFRVVARRPAGAADRFGDHRQRPLAAAVMGPGARARCRYRLEAGHGAGAGQPSLQSATSTTSIGCRSGAAGSLLRPGARGEPQRGERRRPTRQRDRQRRDVCAAPPPAPAGYTAQTGGLLAALSWAARPAATGYFLEAGSGPGLANCWCTTASATRRVSAPPRRRRLLTRVRALNDCGASAPSVEVPVTLGCWPGAVVPAA